MFNINTKTPGAFERYGDVILCTYFSHEGSLLQSKNHARGMPDLLTVTDRYSEGSDTPKGRYSEGSNTPKVRYSEGSKVRK